MSRICTALDAEMAAFPARPLGHVEFPYVFLDATYVKGRVSGQVVSPAVVVATGVRMNGDREVLGSAVGDSEDEAFWSEFLRSLRSRGLTCVRVVISDHHLGLKERHRRRDDRRRLATLIRQHDVGGIVPLVTSAAGRGPWQRDRKGPAADPSLPAVADPDRPVGVVPRVPG